MSRDAGIYGLRAFLSGQVDQVLPGVYHHHPPACHPSLSLSLLLLAAPSTRPKTPLSLVPNYLSSSSFLEITRNAYLSHHCSVCVFGMGGCVWPTDTPRRRRAVPNLDQEDDTIFKRNCCSNSQIIILLNWFLSSASVHSATFTFLHIPLSLALSACFAKSHQTKTKFISSTYSNAPSTFLSLRIGIFIETTAVRQPGRAGGRMDVRTIIPLLLSPAPGLRCCCAVMCMHRGGVGLACAAGSLEPPENCFVKQSFVIDYINPWQTRERCFHLGHMSFYGFN